MSFKTFESDKPLIYIHVDKTGGTTICEYVKEWFHDEKYRLCMFDREHYQPNEYCKIIHHTDLSKKIEQLKCDGIYNPIFFGHLVEDIGTMVPEKCTQFVTIIRNPFDRMVSNYFYDRMDDVDEIINYNMSLEQYICTKDPGEDLVDIFTKEIITLDNYKYIIKKYFIYIGLFEKFNTSILKLATVLEKPANIKILRHLNKSEYTTNVPNHLREFHRNKYPLHYAIYDYIKQLHTI